MLTPAGSFRLAITMAYELNLSTAAVPVVNMYSMSDSLAVLMLTISDKQLWPRQTADQHIYYNTPTVLPSSIGLEHDTCLKPDRYPPKFDLLWHQYQCQVWEYRHSVTDPTSSAVCTEANISSISINITKLCVCNNNEPHVVQDKSCVSQVSFTQANKHNNVSYVTNWWWLTALTARGLSRINCQQPLPVTAIFTRLLPSPGMI